MMLVAAVWPTPADAGLFKIGVKQEMDYGRKADSEIVKQASVNHDKDVNDLVTSIGEQLVPFTDRPDIKYQFRVINDKEINAFSVPGFVYIQTGLMDFIQGDANMRDELAGVIAHELGHTGGRHIAKQLAEQQEAQVGATIFSIFTKSQYDNFIDVGADLFLLGHSRSDEYDADRRGVNTLMRSGVNPQGMVDFFTRLQAKYKDGSKTSEYFQTHPLTGDRIRKVQDEIDENQKNGIPPPKSG